MRKELNIQEQKFIAFLYKTKDELTLRKINANKKKLINFKGTAKERKALKRSNPIAEWKDVKNYLENRIHNLFTGKTLPSFQVANWRKQGPPKMALRNFQEALILKRIK